MNGTERNEVIYIRSFETQDLFSVVSTAYLVSLIYFTHADGILIRIAINKKR